MTRTLQLDQDDLPDVNAALETSSAAEILQWGIDTFGDDLALATGFGPSGVVLMDLVSRLRPDTTIFYLDTGFLFEETHQLRRDLAARLGVRFERVSTSMTPKEQAVTYGPELWKTDPDRCCAIRKVRPLRDFMRSRSAWVTGIRRDQSGLRRSIDIVSWDAGNEAYKLCPLARWTSDDVWSYLRLNDLPYNKLHEQGYPSIGCTHCTRPVASGDDERAGRWAGQSKTECGIHLQPHLAA